MKPWICVSAAALAAIFLLPAASAQTLRAVSLVDVANSEYNGHNHRLALAWDSMEHEFTADSAVSVSGETFTGLNRDGLTQTMTKSGTSTSTAEFRWGSTPALRVAVSGNLVNSLYNPDNPPYFDATVDPPVVDHDGVPDLLSTYGNASFTEILHWGGSATNYLAFYKFRVHGQAAANSDGYAALLVQTAGQTDFWALPGGFSGTYDEIWMSRGFPAGLGAPQPITVTFLTSFTADTQYIPDGGDTQGAYDFGSTITLDAIYVADEEGNPVDGWTLDTASGSAYETGDLPIPETVFEDGFEAVGATSLSTLKNLPPAQCRQLLQRLRSLHAEQHIPQLPMLECSANER
ncbi:MAG: hypothetical protein WCY72_04220 [Lysobacteraceae bacterium]